MEVTERASTRSRCAASGAGHLETAASTSRPSVRWVSVADPRAAVKRPHVRRIRLVLVDTPATRI